MPRSSLAAADSYEWYVPKSEMYTPLGLASVTVETSNTSIAGVCHSRFGEVVSGAAERESLLISFMTRQ
jgi:NADH:ubiquinone oxidoreductase subunit B-like Fe-S oxidoreductase